ARSKPAPRARSPGSDRSAGPPEAEAPRSDRVTRATRQPPSPGAAPPNTSGPRSAVRRSRWSSGTPRVPSSSSVPVQCVRPRGTRSTWSSLRGCHGRDRSGLEHFHQPAEYLVGERLGLRRGKLDTAEEIPVGTHVGAEAGREG